MEPSPSGQTNKPRMLVVDDEPDNLDLLYRTFRRDFRVLRAESGQQALQILAEEGEVAVIISDQRMPEMKGTEFLRKTLPEFPDTMRIILTGFTDVEDLVEAINSGQVHRYVTKPWEPDELKMVVNRAAETYDMLKRRTQELNQVQLKAQLFQAITAAAHAEVELEGMLTLAAQAFLSALTADSCTIWIMESNRLTDCKGVAGQVAVSIAPDALRQVVTHQSPQYLPANDQTGEIVGIQPVSHSDQIMAVIGLRWQSSQPLIPAQKQILAIAADHLAIALKSLACENSR